jgi:hypothetical protein
MAKKIEQQNETKNIICNDKDCPIHKGLKTRGRIFKGIVIKKLNKRIIWLITSDGKIKDSMNSGLMKAFKLNPKNI